jgi:phospholipid/cholesterol/gamma-HCH transport system substrate-binding protein
MYPSRTTQFIVGIFGLVGIAAGLTVLALTLSRTLLVAPSTYTLYAMFDNGSGLKVADSIQIAGVKVGKVALVTLSQKSERARVTLEVDEGVMVDNKAIASIKTSSLIGDKYVAISIGTGEPLKDGGTIRETRSSFVLEDAIGQVVNGGRSNGRGAGEHSPAVSLSDHKSRDFIGAPTRVGASKRGDELDPAFNFNATNLTIFSATDGQIIGHGRYSSSRSGGTDLIRGENKYLDGASEIELDYLKWGDSGEVPALVRHEYSSFNADGSQQFLESLDPASGAASCAENVKGIRRVYRAILDVPSDTYAGATQMMLIMAKLRQGVRETIEFHSFNCVPAPKIFLVSVSVPSEWEEWPMYPGKLLKLELRPDFGWLGILIAAFLPKLCFWFDPNQNWNYVGGMYDRFYKGPHVLTVRDRSVRPASPSKQSKKFERNLRGSS